MTGERAYELTVRVQESGWMCWRRASGRANPGPGVQAAEEMLTRIMRKRPRVDVEVIDPRGWSLTGVPARVATFDALMTDCYDLVVRLEMLKARWTGSR